MPTYEEFRPDPSPYQFAQLMNENQTLKSKAIENYRK